KPILSNAEHVLFPAGGNCGGGTAQAKAGRPAVAGGLAARVADQINRGKDSPMFTRWLSPLPHGRSRRNAQRVQLTVDVLEDRYVPSPLTVASALDDGSAGTLRAQVAAAAAGDVIVFDPSLNGQTITLTQGEINIAQDLVIQGPGAGQLTISGNNASR